MEEDREPVAVISHRYWQRRFAGDPGVVGRVLDVQGRLFTIVGPPPPGFYGTQPGRHIDVTVPLGTQTVKLPPNARWLYLVGRLAPACPASRRAALRVRWAQLADVLPPRPPVTLELDPGAQGLNELRREFSVPLHPDAGGRRGAAPRLRQSRGPVARSFDRDNTRSACGSPWAPRAGASCVSS